MRIGRLITTGRGGYTDEEAVGRRHSEIVLAVHPPRDEVQLGPAIRQRSIRFVTDKIAVPVCSFPWLITGSDGAPVRNVSIAGWFPCRITVGDAVRFEGWQGVADYMVDGVVPSDFVSGDSVGGTLSLSVRRFVPTVAPRAAQAE